MVKASSWVLIQTDLLEPEERSASLPEATRRVPLRMWIKGTLIADAAIGTRTSVRTVTGRIVEGQLIEENPSYRHDFGLYCPELRKIREIVLQAMEPMEESS
jgi:hypothetical protein